MHPCQDLPSRLGRFLFAVLMALAWCGAPQAALSAPPSVPSKRELGPEQYVPLADSLDAIARSDALIDRDLPRESFDPQAVVLKVGNSPERLFEWVRGQTQYAPYRGALRGAVGVLMDRMGNSLDRSLLLAKLLQIAGHEVRLARGQLAQEQAERTLQAVWDQPAGRLEQNREAPSDDIDAAVTKLADKYQFNALEVRRTVEQQTLSSQKLLEGLVSGVMDQSARLQGLIGSPAPADAVAARARQRTAIAEHWWVQWKNAEQWADLDLFADKSGQKITEAQELIVLKADAQTLPLDGSRAHEIELRVVAERWQAGRVEPHVALRYTVRPADLQGQPIALSIFPLDWPGDIDFTAPDAEAHINALLLKQTEWAPTLVVGGQQITQSSFDETGELHEKPIENAISRSTNSKINTATGAFGFGSAPAASGKLTAVWMEFEVRVPGETPRTIRRELFDFFGPAKRDAGALAEATLDDAARLARSAALMRHVDLLPVGCVLPEAFALHLQLAHIVQNVPKVAAILRKASGVPLRQNVEKLSQITPFPVALFSLASNRAGPGGFNLQPVVDRPNLFALNQRVVLGQGGHLLGRQTIDIIANEASVRASSAADSFSAHLKQGVLETHLETIAQLPRRGIANTAALFSASSGQKIPWVTLRGPQDGALSQLKLDPDTRARITSDLKSGYFVVAPAAPVTVAGRVQAGWWRVDPRDGNCVGYMSDGMGSETVEYAFLLFAIAHFVYEVVGCARGGKGLGCYVCAAITLTWEACAFGAALGAAAKGIATAAAISGGLANTGVANGLGAICESMAEGGGGGGGDE
jgi:hypothetical protein